MNATLDPAPAPAPAAPADGKRRRIMILIGSIFALLGLLWLLYWIFVASKREDTDDAYVNGNKVILSSQVAGTVVEVLTDDTQPVKAGQVLVRLDPSDAAIALSRAGNSLAQAVRQVRQQKSTAGDYDAVVASRKLELARAEMDLSKREPLLADQAIAAEELRHAHEAVDLAHAALNQAVRQAAGAHALVDGTPIVENPAVLGARDTYRDAWVAAQRNAIVSPIDGYVAERSVQLGQRITPGQPLLTVIPLQDLWIDANFKEVQLRHLRLKQPAEIRSDLYGGTFIFHGQVEGVSAGTGAAFSLLPAQNASGNWIKVTQRVPVRIHVNPDDLAKHPLRVGLSTTVTVDIRSQDGAVLAAEPGSGVPESTAIYTQDQGKADADADALIRRNLGGDQ
jgi:membrane fusion protein, multidrug efflux system